MFRLHADRTGRPLRLTATLLGLGLVAAACSDTGTPGIEIQALQADVVFGVELLPEDGPVALPTQQVPETVGQPVRLADGGLTIPFRNKLPDRFQNVAFRVPTPPVVECPAASIGASPSEAAPEEVTTLPPEGLSQWKRDITLTQTLEGVDIVSRTQGFESRIVRDVEVTGEGSDPVDGGGQQFRYQTVAPDGLGNAVVSTYRVNTNPVARGANSNVDTEGTTETGEATAEGAGVPLDIPDEAQEALPNPNRVRVGEPNRGLVLTSQQIVDGNGVAQGTFNLQPPGLLLPLPVETGDTWTTTSSDPTSGQTMRISGVVNERETVDACGSLLDAWRAELDITIANSSGTVTRRTELLVSTSLGATIIGERIVEDSLDDAGRPVKFEATYGIAQTEPDPVDEDGGNA